MLLLLTAFASFTGENLISEPFSPTEDEGAYQIPGLPPLHRSRIISGPVTISGSIHLPPGFVAPPGGIPVEVGTIINDYEYMCTHCFGGRFTIPEGKKEVPFKITIKATDAPRYRLRFFQPKAGFRRSGYYGKNGTHPFRQESPDMWIDVTKGNVVGIRIEVPADESVIDYDLFREQAADYQERLARQILNPAYTDFEKALLLHDTLIERLEYYSDEAAERKKLTSFKDIHTEPIPVMLGVGICGSYSGAFEAMARSGGLESIRIIARREVTDHAWSTARIDGNYYHVDVTVDDNRYLERFSYELFLLNDEQLSRRLEKINRLENVWDRTLVNTPPLPFEFRPAHYPHKKELQNPLFRRVIGNIRLPEAAGPEGLWISIEREANRVRRRAGLVFIPPGRSHAFFAFQIPRQTEVKSYHIRLVPSDNIYLTGYYTGSSVENSVGKAVPIQTEGEDLFIDYQLRKPLSGRDSRESSIVNHIVSQKKVVRIRHQMTGCYFTEVEQSVQCIDAPSEASNWTLERVTYETDSDNWVYIKRNKTETAIHLQDRKKNPQASFIKSGWTSAQWILRDAPGNGLFIDNRWTQERITLDRNRELLLTIADPEQEDSSQWVVEAIP